LTFSLLICFCRGVFPAPFLPPPPPLSFFFFCSQVPADNLAAGDGDGCRGKGLLQACLVRGASRPAPSGEKWSGSYAQHTAAPGKKKENWENYMMLQGMNHLAFFHRPLSQFFVGLSCRLQVNAQYSVIFGDHLSFMMLFISVNFPSIFPLTFMP
jgi:hypothetical protein